MMKLDTVNGIHGLTKQETTILACLPLFVLSSTFIISAIYSFIFIVSFLLVVFTRVILDQFALDKMLKLGIQLILLTTVNSIIQSVINIINPFLFSINIIQLNLIQFLPFIFLQTHTVERGAIGGLVITGIFAAFSSTAIGFFREIITYGTIALGYTKMEKPTILFFHAGQAPWFVFIILALAVALIKYTSSIRNSKRKVTDGPII